MDVLTLLPDEPRWVEPRGMILSGRGRPVEVPGHPVVAVMAADAALAFVFRWDDRQALAAALGAVPTEFSIVAPGEATHALSAVARFRPMESATIATRPPGVDDLPPPDPRVRLLGPADRARLEGLPPELRGQMIHALTFSPLAATFEDGQPVSFCFAAWETESWWDVSVDTLEAWRRGGRALAACAALLRHQAARGRRAVWGTVDSNAASGRLGRKLGFQPVDRLVLAYPE